MPIDLLAAVASTIANLEREIASWNNTLDDMRQRVEAARFRLRIAQGVLTEIAETASSATNSPRASD